MNGLLLTASEDGFTLPDDPLGVAIWIVFAAIILGAYIVSVRIRRRAREDYIASKRLEAEMKANDPDMKKE